MERLTQFRQLLSEGKFDGFVVTAPAVGGI